MRVIIAGSRSITDINEVKRAINASNWKEMISIVVSGTARGVDRLGEACAKLKGWDLIQCPANWDAKGKEAGFIRNALMADIADRLIAVWDGESGGTKNMIGLMEKKGKPVFIWDAKHQAGIFIPGCGGL